MTTKPALLIIDMQARFLGGGVATTPPLDDVLDVANHVAGLFRARGLPVIRIMDEERGGPGTDGFEAVAGLSVAEGDIEVRKVASDAFRDTPLASLLSDLGVDLVLVAGFSAEACVLSTLKGAEARDLPHAVLRGGILARSPDGAAFVERIFPLVSWEVIEAFLP